MTRVKLRPHHLKAIEDHLLRPIETVESLRKSDCSPEYIENERSLIQKVLTENGCMVEIVPAIDDLCMACHNKLWRCSYNDPVGVMDYMESLGLQVGGTYLGRDIIRNIHDKRLAFMEAQRR